MLIAQITDLHVVEPGALCMGRVDTAAMLRQALMQLDRMRPRPDLVLATGDLVNDGRPDQYAHLGRILAEFGWPVALLPGNHDDRRALAQALPQPGWDDGAFLHRVIDDHALRVIALDSLRPGSDGGALCAARLAWLDARLAEDRRPTLVALHHPPFETGISWMDRIGLDGRDAFAAVIRRHPHVERVIAGHLHRAIQTRFAGTIASTAPSTAHQVILDLEPGNIPCFTDEPPGFDVHLWREGAGLVGHTVQVGTFQAQPFAA